MYKGYISVAMLAETYVPPGTGRYVDKLKRHVRHLGEAVKTRYAALQESFATMRWEIDQLWSGVQAANAGAPATHVAPPTSAQPNQDIGFITEHISKNLPF